MRIITSQTYYLFKKWENIFIITFYKYRVVTTIYEKIIINYSNFIPLRIYYQNMYRVSI